MRDVDAIGIAWDGIDYTSTKDENHPYAQMSIDLRLHIEGNPRCEYNPGHHPDDPHHAALHDHPNPRSYFRHWFLDIRQPLPDDLKSGIFVNNASPPYRDGRPQTDEPNVQHAWANRVCSVDLEIYPKRERTVRYSDGRTETKILTDLNVSGARVRCSNFTHPHPTLNIKYLAPALGVIKLATIHEEGSTAFHCAGYFREGGVVLP